jgi:23S rRNA pseudouridine2605 synthase
MAQQRLQKILAAAGIDSRRNCEDLIVEGQVRVNNRVVDTLPAFADPLKDVITVSGRRVQAEQKRYFLLNKPIGVICTNSDPDNRRKAIDFIKTDKRIFCAGRLDADTTGLIILTNDSELTNKLTHPKFELAKTYVVKVKGQIRGEQIERLKKGVWLAEGKTGRASVKVLKRNFKESLVEIKISQGLNRQVRRMFAGLGMDVVSLTRTKIGKLTSRGLGIGSYRELTHQELAYLKKATSFSEENSEF